MIDIRQEVTAVIEATILVVAALFPIVNPLGSAAIFVNLVGPIAPPTQRLLAQKIGIYSFFLLLCSLLWGVHVLAFFGIQIYAVQIGGGLVVAATGWSLLGQDTGRAKTTPSADDEILENAFYPFTLPITVGPGSISVAITLGAHLPPELHEASLFSLRVLIAAIAGITLVCLIIYCVLCLCAESGAASRQIRNLDGDASFLIHPTLHRRTDYLHRHQGIPSNNR